MHDRYITREKLEEFVQIFPNAFDKAYCCMLYEGFTAEQILCLKRNDISAGGIRTCDGKNMSVSDKTLAYLVAADNQKHYYVYNHLCDDIIAKKLQMSEYVIKFLDKGDDTEPVDFETKHRRIQRRLYKMQRLKKGTTLYTEKGIYFSGMVSALLPIVLKYGNLENAYHEEEFLLVIQRWNQEKWRARNIFLDFYGDIG